MWGEFCNIYSPNAEKDIELQLMDLNTLKMIYNNLDNKLKSLKDKKPKNKSIEGLELACQVVFGLIADKSYMEENEDD